MVVVVVVEAERETDTESPSPEAKRILNEFRSSSMNPAITDSSSSLIAGDSHSDENSGEPPADITSPDSSEQSKSEKQSA